MSEADLPLIRDAINRMLRTLIQQLVVVVLEVAAFLAVQPDLVNVQVWQVAVLLGVHSLLSVGAAYAHRTLIDPAPVPSLEPPDTPTPRFGPTPLEPPAPYSDT